MSRKLRESFVGHPDAILFLRISRERVFQQPQGDSAQNPCSGHLERYRDSAIANDLLLMLGVADICGAINGDRPTPLNAKPLPFLLTLLDNFSSRL